MRACSCALAIALLASSASSAQASILGPILDDIQRHIEEAMNRANTNLNIAEGNTYQLLHGIVEQTRRALQDDLNKDLDRLTDKQKALVHDLQEAVDLVDKNVGKNLAIAEVRANRFLSKIEFWKGELPFMVAGIDGATLQKGGNEYIIIVYGNGFGINEGSIKYNTTVMLSDKGLPATQLDPQPTGLKIIVPSEMIAPFFQRNRIMRIPLKLSSKITRPCFPNLFDLFSCEDNFETKFNITLYPEVAATATVQSYKYCRAW
jgi:hypothetical protein